MHKESQHAVAGSRGIDLALGMVGKEVLKGTSAEAGLKLDRISPYLTSEATVLAEGVQSSQDSHTAEAAAIGRVPESGLTVCVRMRLNHKLKKLHILISSISASEMRFACHLRNACPFARFLRKCIVRT